MNPAQLGQNLWTCLQCEARGQPENGVARCRHSSRDIRTHAQWGDCPAGRFAEPMQGLDQKRDLCKTSCPAFGGFAQTICGLEEDGPEVVHCLACSCPLKTVNLRTGRCPRRRWR